MKRSIIGPHACFILKNKRFIFIILLITASQFIFAQPVKSGATATSKPMIEWNTKDVKVSSANGLWTIKGKKQVVTFNESDLALNIKTSSAQWKMVPSQSNDMIVKKDGKEFPIRLSDARRHKIEYYNTGYKNGIKITLEDWKGLDVKLYLTVCLEGNDEDLVFDIAAQYYLFY